MKIRVAASMTFVLAAISLAAAACGDDDGDNSSATTAAAATTAAPATTAAGSATTAAGGDVAEVCALATEMDGQDGFPTHAQLAQYQQIAPAEIAASVGVAAAALAEIPDGDVINFFKAIAKDEVQDSIMAINVWETDNCGIDHEDSVPSPGSTWEIDPNAARVDVRAEDYKLTMPSTIQPGLTSFVLTNHGAEVHHMVIFQLADGVTLEQALSDDATEDMILGSWQTGLAFPDGEDEEPVTFDLAAGNYGVACFIAGADGTPHAFGHAMHASFTAA